MRRGLTRYLNTISYVYICDKAAYDEEWRVAWLAHYTEQVHAHLLIIYHVYICVTKPT